MEGEREGNYINIYTCIHIYIYIIYIYMYTHTYRKIVVIIEALIFYPKIQ